ncbi:zinc ribbon domain-containing protein [Clostridium sp. DL1XJH146]
MKKNGMIGRYGLDRFSKFLLILGLVQGIFEWSRIVGILFVGYAIFRMMSKDFDKRKREEMAYIKLVGTLKYRLDGLKYRLTKKINVGFLGKTKRKFNSTGRKVKDRKNYVIIKCPECKQKLRLPRGKGNLLVTCKNCKHQFRKRT